MFICHCGRFHHNHYFKCHCHCHCHYYCRCSALKNYRSQVKDSDLSKNKYENPNKADDLKNFKTGFSYFQKFLKLTGIQGRASKFVSSLALKFLKKLARCIGCAFFLSCCSSCILLLTQIFTSIFFFIPSNMIPNINNSFISDGAIVSISAFDSNMISATTTGNMLIWDSKFQNVKKNVKTGIIVDLEYFNNTKIVSINRDCFMLVHTNDGELILDLNLKKFGSLNSLHIHDTENIIIGTSSGKILFLSPEGNISNVLDNKASLISVIMLKNGNLVSADSNKEIKIRNGYLYEQVSITLTNHDLESIKKLDAYTLLDIEFIFYSIGSNLYIINSNNGKICNKINASNNIVSFTWLFNTTLMVLADSKSLSYYNLTDGLLMKKLKFDSEILCLDSNSDSIFIGEGNGKIKVINGNISE